MKKTKKVPKSVTAKTRKLIIEEGRDPKQAYAIAWSLFRKHLLGPRGGIKRKLKRKHK